MKALIVSAAPSGRALTADLTATAASTLRAHGHDVDVLDLVRLGWDPVVGPADYGVDELTAPIGAHARCAAADGLLAPEVSRHQALLRRADLLVLVFPLWWAGMPAVLKGWVDRVFTEGFAYGLRDADGNPRKYGDGALAGRRGLVVTTAGDRPSSFGARGVNGHIEDLLFPINHGIFWYTGIAPLAPLTLLGVDAPTWGGVEDARGRVRRRFAGIETERPLAYRRLLEDYDGDRELHARLAPGRGDLAIHLTPGVRDRQPV
ncbi:NAD(P)H-dependent oxidoreductase [Isoptericola chiayiensis]|uniref:NAD(P)H-dependent oxidoreductase n=1 Tax=Isoptericola chiayiensis TaxID=579446 RepID=A0ABP8Y1J9_9MICO|nr:NAD(P)H-dependent oxidoreductase [Isoptericola chiayiensis]NOV99628.1 NAD(P)H dehydrogenase (quinone) [Isoptericola chiayiensis]